MKLRVFTDLHYTEEIRDASLEHERAAFYEAAFCAFTAPGVDALVSLGDLSTSSNPDAMRRVAARLARAPFPVHYVYGNHDTMFTNEAHMDAIFGRCANYSFNADGAHFVVLDTTNPFDADHWGGHLTKSQLMWLESEMEWSQGMPLVVMGHHALVGTTAAWSTEPNHFVDNSEDVLAVLDRHEGGLGVYLCGHTHRNGRATRPGWEFLMLADVPDAACYLELDVSAAGVGVEYLRFDDAEERPFAAGIPIFEPQGRAAAEDGCLFE